MKKQTLAAAALALLLLAGCAEQPPSYDDTGSGSQPESSIAYSESVLPESGTSSLAGEESESPVVSEVPEAEKSSASPQEQPETQPPTVSSEPKQEEQYQDPTASSQPVATQEEKEPASQPEQPQSTTTAPNEPITSESQTQPELTIFDVSAYVQTAKDYGAQIGLALDSTATACWDDPLTANAGCLYLTRDLQDRLDWYKQSGFTAFWVWSEQIAGEEYLIYIGYA